jgi:uncharacterized protein YggU (UPF0235/DUF167 family)
MAATLPQNQRIEMPHGDIVCVSGTTGRVSAAIKAAAASGAANAAGTKIYMSHLSVTCCSLLLSMPFHDCFT